MNKDILIIATIAIAIMFVRFIFKLAMTFIYIAIIVAIIYFAYKILFADKEA